MIHAYAIKQALTKFPGLNTKKKQAAFLRIPHNKINAFLEGVEPVTIYGTGLVRYNAQRDAAYKRLGLL